MDLIFDAVYLILDWLSDRIGLSYQGVNAAAYFILLPATYLHLLDRIMRRHLLLPAFTVAVVALLVANRDYEAAAARLFQGSVTFLESFEIIGWNYGTASVVVCVFVPLMLFVTLLHFSYPRVMGLGQRKPRRSHRPEL